MAVKEKKDADKESKKDADASTTTEEVKVKEPAKEIKKEKEAAEKKTKDDKKEDKKEKKHDKKKDGDEKSDKPEKEKNSEKPDKGKKANGSSDKKNTADMPAEERKRLTGDYEKMKKELKESIGKKRALDRQLNSLEEQIYKFEGSYLEETQNGNVVRGFDNFIKTNPNKRRATFSEQDRVFFTILCGVSKG